MSAKNAYTPFNEELEELINATPERAAAVAEIRAEIDLATAAAHETTAPLPNPGWPAGAPQPTVRGSGGT